MRVPGRLRRTDRRRSAGQALVEVALVAPLFFAMLFGIIDLARVIWANDAVANAAREGARYASVHAGTVTLTTEATPEQIKEHTLGFVIAGGVNTQVTVCVSAVHVAEKRVGCSGDVNESPSIGFERGNMVTVRVTSDVPIFVGALTGLGDFTVSGESTVLINN